MLRNEDLPFKMRMTVGDVELEGDLTDISLETIEITVMSEFVTEFLQHMAERIAEEGYDALTDEEFDEFEQWYNDCYGIDTDSIIGIMEHYDNFYQVARDKYIAILQERKHYYKVTVRVTQDIEVWVRADCDAVANDLANEIHIYDVDNMDLINAGDMDWHIEDVEEADDEYCGEELIAEQED